MKLRSAYFTLALTSILIVLVAMWRASTPSPVSGMPEDQFWAVKYSHTNDADIVLAGCSRVYRGLSPRAIKSVIPGVRVINFGFSATSYEPNYFRAVDRVLAGNSKRKIIVMGVAPHNFKHSNAESNGFLDLKKQNAACIELAKQFGSVAHYTRPLSLSGAKSLLTGRQYSLDSGYFQVFHEDGWVESKKIPENPSELVADFKKGAIEEPPDPELVNQLLNQVRKWHADGIQVYGLRIPTSAAMREVEDTFSRFNESSFKHKFETAGGIWIPVPLDGYDSYDGSHLRADSAIKLSRIVGEFINKRLTSRPIETTQP